MQRTIHSGLAAVAALALGLVINPSAMAQHDHGGGGMSMPSPSVRTGKVKGTLVSRDETSIKVETKQSKEAATIAYMIDGKTKFEGDIRPGSEVTIKYEERADMRRATSVQAKKQQDKHSH